MRVRKAGERDERRGLTPGAPVATSPRRSPRAPACGGFSLVEILVALVVFAALAAITWGALGQVVRVRAELAAQQDRFAALVRAMGDLERDLRQSVSRPLRGHQGELLPAVAGRNDRVELSRIGFASPRAEPRSHVERVGYAVDAGELVRERWPVLDRAAGSTPERRRLLEGTAALHLRYLGDGGQWHEQWPPREARPGQLPRAIEWRLVTTDFGELRRVVLLPSSLPARAAEAGATAGIPVAPVGIGVP